MNTNPHGMKSCSSGIPGTGGGGLHVTYATGNVWTKVPILAASGNGEETLNLELYYNSLNWNEDTGLGNGWRIGYDYSLVVIPTQCYLDCPQPPSEGCSGCVCGPLSPAQLRFRDGNGLRTVFYDQVGICSNDCTCEGSFPQTGDPFHPPLGRDRLVHLLESGQGEANEYCRVEFPDGQKWYYFGVSQERKIARMVSARGLTTRFSYDANDRLQSVTDGFGRVITFVWGTGGHLSEIIHPDDTPGSPVRTSLSYATIGAETFLSSITDPESEETSFDYEPNGLHRLNEETLKNDVVFYCTYAGNSRTLTASKNGSQPVQILSVLGTNHDFPTLQAAPIPEQGTIVVTDEQGMEWHYINDDRGRLSNKRLESSPADGPLYGASVNYVEFVHGIEDPPEDYPDSYERIRSTRTGPFGAGLEMIYTWGPFGTITSKTVVGTTNSSFEYETTYAYEDPNFPAFLTKKTLPNDGIWEYTYNSKGDVTQILDPIREEPVDQFETYDYVYFGSTEDPPPGLTSSDGRLKTVTYSNRNGYQTIWTYNNVGNLVSRQVETQNSPQTFITTTYDHDAMGRQTLESVDRGDVTFAVTKSTYDKMGRVETETRNFAEGNPNDPPLDPEIFNLETIYDYDGHGLIERVTNPRGVITEFEYDHLNRESKMTEDPGTEPEHLNLVTLTEWNVALQWHTGANTLRITDAEERMTEYVLDGKKRPFEVLDAEGYKTRYQRDILGNPERIWRQRKSTDPVTGEPVLTYSALYDDLGRTLTSRVGEDPETHFSYDWSDGAGSGCSCGGQGGSTPRRITYNPGDFHIPSITFNKVDPIGRTTQVLRKGGVMPNPQGGNDVPDERPEADEDDSLTVIKYDAEGNVSLVTGPEGETTDMDYDGANRLISRTVNADPFAALTTTFQYDGMDNVKSVTEPTGHVVEYQYDGADRLSRAFDDLGDLVVYSRDANGNMRSRTDGNGNTWSYFYDAADRLKELHDPIVESTDGIYSYEYDRVGNLLQEENRNRGASGIGVKTRYFYDRLNRITKKLEDYNEQAYTESQQELDGEGESGVQGGGTLQGGGGTPGGGGSILSQTATSTPVQNTETHFKYDGRFLIEIRDHHDTPDTEENGNKTTYEYNRAGRVLQVQYPDTEGNCESSDDCNGAAPGRKLEFRYYLTTNEIERVDQRGVSTTHKFDEFGRLFERSNLSGAVPVRKDVFGYDRSHRLTVAGAYIDADANGGDAEFLESQWQRTYDKAGRPLEESQSFFNSTAADYVTTNSYILNTSAQTLTQEICYPNCGSRIVERVWDKRGRVSSANAGSDIGADWIYDAGNRRIGATRRNGTFNSSQYSYDDNDRVTDIKHFSNLGGIDPSLIARLSYGYDAEGNRLFTENHLATNRSEAYGHDNRHRLTWMNRGELTTDSAGQRVVEVADWLVSDKLAGREEWSDLDRRGNWRYSCRRLNGVTHEQTRKANGVNAYFEIDPDGPRKGVVTCTGNCLTSVYPAHDAAGNLVFEPLAKLAGQTPNIGSRFGPGLEFEYDVENRLQRISMDTNDAVGPVNGQTPEPKVMEFSYDALGRRVETIEYIDPATGQRTDGVGANPNPRKTRHVYFGLEVIQQYECGGAQSVGSCDSSPLLVRDFVWGDSERYPEVVAMQTYTIYFPEPEDPPISVPSAAYHYLHDVLGSVIGLVDDAGELVERYTYDPYGKVLIEKWDATANGGSGAWLASAEPTSGLPVSSVGNPFMWTGHRYDPAVGLYATLFRAYSPTLGRWLQRDPIEHAGGGLNLYEYTHSNPLISVDSFGLQATSQPAPPPTPPTGTEITLNYLRTTVPEEMGKWMTQKMMENRFKKGKDNAMNGKIAGVCVKGAFDFYGYCRVWDSAWEEALPYVKLFVADRFRLAVNQCENEADTDDLTESQKETKCGPDKDGLVNFTFDAGSECGTCTYSCDCRGAVGAPTKAFVMCTNSKCNGSADFANPNSNPCTKFCKQQRKERDERLKKEQDTAQSCGH